MKAWRAKIRDAFGIDAIPSVNMTMEKLYGDVYSVEEKAPIPSGFEPKVIPSESQAWTNAQGGEQGVTEAEAYSRVENLPYMEDVYMETPRSTSPTRRKSSQTRGEDGRGPYDDDYDDDDED